MQNMAQNAEKFLNVGSIFNWVLQQVYQGLFLRFELQVWSCYFDT